MYAKHVYARTRKRNTFAVERGTHLHAREPSIRFGIFGACISAEIYYKYFSRLYGFQLEKFVDSVFARILFANETNMRGRVKDFRCIFRLYEVFRAYRSCVVKSLSLSLSLKHDTSLLGRSNKDQV